MRKIMKLKRKNIKSLKQKTNKKERNNEKTLVIGFAAVPATESNFYKDLYE